MKKLTSLLTVLLSVSMLFGCANNNSVQDKVVEEDTGNWAVYIYMCGSDLESKYASATNNLAALCEGKLGEETSIVIETGGTSAWQNDVVREDIIQRRTLGTDKKVHLVDETEQANMGDPDTLESFLKFATENYPAEKTMLILWDHGGGTNGGCCVDENFDDDTLTLQEIHQAFENTFDFSQEKRPIDILGFDACLMASIDVADMFKDYASYLLASQEEEPSLGWDYTSLVNKLTENPTQSPVELGTSICDTYLSNLQANDQDYSATLSLTDLSKIEPLKEKFEFLIDEMLMSAYGNPKFFQSYAIDAKNAENYGGNTKSENYSYMVDIQSFSQQASDDFDCTDDIIQALEDCVVYKVNGPYRNQGGGLSFFFNHNGNAEANDVYKEQGCIQPLRTLFDVEISEKLDKEEKKILKELELDEKKKPKVLTFDTLDQENYPLIQYNKKGQMYVDFGEKVQDSIVNAMYNLLYFNDQGEEIFIGQDNDEVDFTLDSGKVTKLGNQGNWLFVDDTLVFSRLDYVSPEYNLYSIPIMVDLNDGNGKQRAYLQIAFDFDENQWMDMGFRLETGHVALGNRVMYFEDGQEFTLLEEYFDENNDICERELKTLTYSDALNFDYKKLPDGEYIIEFRIEDMVGNYYFSENDVFVVENGEISFPNKN